MGRIREFFRRLFGRGRAPAPAASLPHTTRVVAAPATRGGPRRSRPRSKAPGDGRPQCGAITAADKQCSRRARSHSNYCGLHKGYQPPGRPAARKARDTRPTARRAKDTRPTARREQVTRHGYRLYKNGNRYFFSKKPQAKVSGDPVYSMPAGYSTVRTPSGLPVLKRSR